MKVQTFDFKKGVSVAPSVIQRWHEDIYKYLSSGKGKSYTIASGNSIVIGKVETYDHDLENPVIVIYEVIGGYWEYKYTDFKNDQKC